jgi:hypothetical protein
MSCACVANLLEVAMLNRIVVSSLVCLPVLVMGCEAAPAGWKTFRDPSFSISYPPDYSLDESLVAEAGKGSHVFNFIVPERVFKGTNLSGDSRVSVEILHDSRNCTPDQFLDGVTGYSVERQGALVFNVAKSGDAGAGNFYENDVYAVANSKPCIAVRYLIHSHNIMNYDPGSVRPFDAVGLAREFDEIRKSLVVKVLKP